MSAVSPIAYLKAQHVASQEASARLVEHLTRAGIPAETAHQVVAQHIAGSAERLHSENESILDANIHWTQNGHN
ncbi:MULTISPECIES: hypothetical protein [unclassified Methylobacterium]|jgi:pyrroline-5-carboxylate reductase|uniref:hypothetical protein n=1 Tax=unclassified Methylobacterium TaxID=2615210 RepID=UPI0012E8416A|nr:MULTISPECIES: hypothetical protein [unclassified Methylobacterium]MBO1019091.1 hypothetical protein [Methylobacterium sp. SD274]